MQQFLLLGHDQPLFGSQGNRVLSLLVGVVGLLQCRIHRVHLCRNLGSRRMAHTAMALIRPQKKITCWTGDIVLSVASHALRGSLSGHPRFVGTLQIILFRLCMALPTDVGHLLIAGRGSTVFPVTCRAGGCPQVLVLKHRHTVDTLLIQLILVGGDAIGIHQSLVCVTAGTHRRLVGGIDLRGGIGHLEDAMPVMAVKAGSNVSIALQERLSMLALPILIQLVGRQIKRPHQVYPRMARAAQARNAVLGQRPQVSCFGGHGLPGIRLGGIPAMAAHAAHTLRCVHTLGPIRRDPGVFATQALVA